MTLELLPSPIHSTQRGIAPAHHRCDDCPVRASSLCGSLSDEELVSLNRLGRRRIVQAGQIVSWAGDPASMFANVISGALKITALTVDGREQIVGLLFPGDFVGQLFSDKTQLTVTAMVESDLCTYPRSAFEAMLDTFPRLERTLLQRVLASLNEARDRMLTLGRKTAQERVAGFIQYLAMRSGDVRTDGTVDVILPVNRTEMADYLGLTIETICRQLTRLRTMSVIAFGASPRDCRILDSEQLDYLANPI